MPIFLILILFSFVYLFFKIRNAFSGKFRNILSGSILIFFLVSIFCRNVYGFHFFSYFFFVWFLFTLFFFVFADIIKIPFLFFKTKKWVLSAKYTARILISFSFLITGSFFIYGTSHNNNYEKREATISVSKNAKPFSAIFFSDIHLDYSFQKEKLERFIKDLKEIKPDYILFGGDLADISVEQLTELGFDSLMQEIGKQAKIKAYAIKGNHEIYMEKSGSNSMEWLSENGFEILNDSTVCDSILCVTGRVDLNAEKITKTERKLLSELLPENDSLPWILLDHQPKGVQEILKQKPTIALSGHTHNGQFFPVTIFIHWIWNLAYGFGNLNEIPWLVSSGFDCWGPKIRVHSDSEFWILHFKNKE